MERPMDTTPGETNDATNTDAASTGYEDTTSAAPEVAVSRPAPSYSVLIPRARLRAHWDELRVLSAQASAHRDGQSGMTTAHRNSELDRLFGMVYGYAALLGVEFSQVHVALADDQAEPPLPLHSDATRRPQS